MVMNMQNAFDNEIKYKLFRTVREILHPTISKKNISNYKIIIDESILPVRIFYPKKIKEINKIIIYIHINPNVTDSTSKYSNINKKISLKTNHLVIAIDYIEKKHKFEETYQNIYNTIKYIYDRLEENEIKSEDIILMGDSTGGNIITGINYLNKEEIQIKKEILFYPTISLEYFGKTKYNSMSKNSRQLLLEFLYFVFHSDDNLLDIEIGSFGTGGVDLAAHFLYDETEFLALRFRLSHRFKEVVAMLAQADFFFRDV